MKLGQLVMVEWLDATTQNGWSPAEDRREPERCLTVGWLLRDDEIAISIAASLGFDDDGEINGVNAVTTIPHGMVHRIKKVKVNGHPWA
jgi:hypothetical protein